MSEYIIDLAAHNASAAMALCSGVREKIVRCRDCRYRRAFEQPLNLEFVCCSLRGSLYAVEDEGFCAWGVRRES